MNFFNKQRNGIVAVLLSSVMAAEPVRAAEGYQSAAQDVSAFQRWIDGMTFSNDPRFRNFLAQTRNDKHYPYFLTMRGLTRPS